MLRVLWAGRTRDPHLAALVAEFTARLRRYAPIRLEEIMPGRGGRPGEAARLESERFLSRIPPAGRLVLLDEAGQQMGSKNFALWLQERLAKGPGDLHFVLGGHEGVDRSLRDRAGEVLSLSAMTLTHEMARVFFLEQLYRAFTIMRGERYHH